MNPSYLGVLTKAEIHLYKGWVAIIWKGETNMLTELSPQSRVAAILAIVFGILILAIPAVLHVLIGVFLIVVGILFFVRRK
jgi:uncharacterized membrane protein